MEWRAFMERLDALPALPRDDAGDERRFIALVRTLEGHLGYPCPYEVGLPLQDEAVYGDVLLPPEALAEDYIVRLRASRSGNLATVYDWDGAVKPDQFAIIVATVEEFGYLYVPSAVLNTPYTGHRPPRLQPTWNEKLFGYL